MRRIASGITDQYVYFNAGQVGLSSFTVYRSRNGAAAAAMTTPTINETDATNMPGVYELLLDEDMTVGAGNITEHMAFWITHAGMEPQFLEVELFEPANYVIGNVTLVDTTTTNTDMRGTDSAATAAALATTDAVADAIKVVTDKFVFTVANEVDANIQSVNDVTVTGDGETGTEWNPA